MSVLTAAIAKAYQRDPEATKALLRFSLADLPVDDPSTLADGMAGYIAERVAIAKRGLGRSYVESMVAGHYPDDAMVTKHARWLADLDAFAADLAGISPETVTKAYETWSSRGERRNWSGEVFRDAKGRFSSKIGDPGTRGIDFFTSEYKAGGRRVPKQAMGTVVQADDDGNVGYSDPANEERYERWFGRYAGSVEAGDSLIAQARRLGINLDGARVEATVANEGNEKQRRRIAQDLSTFKTKGWEGKGVDLGLTDVPQEISLTGLDSAAARRLAAYGALSGVVAPEQAANVVGNQENWLRAAQALGAPTGVSEGGRMRQSRTEQAFERTGAIGRAIENIPGARGISDVLTTIGDAGPQVEEALRPAIQRTAGRYQGQERAIDPELSNALTSKQVKDISGFLDNQEMRGEIAVQAASQASQGPKERGKTSWQPGMTRETALGVGRNVSMESGSALFAMQRYPDASEDQAKLALRGDLATDYFISKLPDPQSAFVSRLSGQVLPSQGVAIDMDGNPVQQSQGLTDDHYLPFTLKGLNAIDGGQYVRTRVNGGLTSEDVRTLLTSGARKATVVSRSGVFSLELDPTAQGAGKTAQLSQRMSDNYARILDAVNGSGQYLRDLPAEQKLQIESEVRQANQFVEDPGQLQQLIDAKMDKVRADSERLTFEEMQDIKRRAVEEGEKLGARDEREIAEIEARLTQEAERGKVMRMRLNAEGYAAALQTLQAQFPYLIREASYEPLDQFYANRGQNEKAQAQARAMQQENAEDAGYVGIGETQASRVGTNAVAERRLPEGIRAEREAARAPAEETGTTEGGGESGGGGTGAPKQEGEKPKTEANAAPTAQTGLDQAVKSSSEQLNRARGGFLDRISGLGQVLAGDPQVLSGHTFAQSWDEIASRGNHQAQIKDIVLGSDPNVLSEGLKRDPALVAEVFADRKAIRDMMTASTEIATMFDAGPVQALGGATDVDSAVQFISDAARDMSDLAFIQGGAFVPQTNALAVDPRNKNGKAMAFPDIAAINTTQQLKAFMASDTPGAEAAENGLAQLRVTDGQGNYLPLTTVGKNVHQRIGALQGVAELSRALGSNPGLDPGQAASQIAAKIGTSPDTLAQAAGFTNHAELAQADPDDVVNHISTGKSPEDMNAEAEELQRGLALYTVARGLNLLGGGVDPKGLSGLEEWVVKRASRFQVSKAAARRMEELDRAQERWEALRTAS